MCGGLLVVDVPGVWRAMVICADPVRARIAGPALQHHERYVRVIGVDVRQRWNEITHQNSSFLLDQPPGGYLLGDDRSNRTAAERPCPSSSKGGRPGPATSPLGLTSRSQKAFSLSVPTRRMHGARR